MSTAKIFIQSCGEALGTQCGLTIKVGRPFVLGKEEVKMQIEVVTSIGTISPAFHGAMALGFPADTFLKVASQVLGEPFAKIDEQNQDFASEMLNIIFGVTKTKLSAETDVVIEPSIPVLTIGKLMHFGANAQTPTTVIPFECEHGPFIATVALTPTKD